MNIENELLKFKEFSKVQRQIGNYNKLWNSNKNTLIVFMSEAC